MLFKQVKINFYSGAIKSGLIWIISVLVFFYCNFTVSNVANSNITSILLISIIIGVLSYLVLIYSLTNLLEIKLKKYNSYLKLFIIILYIVFLIFGVPIAILGGMVKLSVLTSKINSTSPSTTVINQSLDENKLWNFINSWEKQQGYQPYTKDENLCKAGDYLLSNPSIMDNPKDWFKKTNLDQSYYFSGYNPASSFNSEEAVFNYWTTNKDNYKNLKDTYFKYSCIKCQKLNCIQMFANIGNTKIYAQNNNINNNSNSDNREYGVVKQVSKYEYNANFGNDSRMATPNEILIAVNNYRNQNGQDSVSWDDGLAVWAQSRAALFATNDLDQHAGFNAEIESKAQSMGLKGAGEDSFLGGSLEAVHLIEWTFAQDEPHKVILLGNFNVLGIGVASGNKGYGVDLIFGRK